MGGRLAITRSEHVRDIISFDTGTGMQVSTHTAQNNALVLYDRGLKPKTQRKVVECVYTFLKLLLLKTCHTKLFLLSYKHI